MKTAIVSSEYKIDKDFNGTVEVLPWDSFLEEKPVNFSDYDNLIIDLASLEKLDRTITLNTSLKQFELRFGYEQVYEILNGDKSSIIILGNPNTKILKSNIIEQVGLSVTVKSSSGDNFSDYYDNTGWRLKDYVSKIKSYEYLYRNIEVGSLGHKGINYLQELHGLLARNKEDFIAVSLRLEISDNLSGVTSILSGNIDLLPVVQDSQKSIEFILDAIVGAKNSCENEPEWAKDIVVSGQETCDRKIRAKQEKIKLLNEEIEKEINNRIIVRQIIELLHRSNKALEDAVADSLKGMGCTVEIPEERNKEEFSFSYGVNRFVVEVKSTKKTSIDFKGFRQLEDWQDDMYEQTGEFYKKLLITNIEFDKQPSKRQGLTLADNQMQYSEKKEICVLETTRLFEFIDNNRENKKEIENFFDRLSKTNGLFTE